MSDPLVPVDLYGVIVHDATSGFDWLDASTLRYTVDGARLAWTESCARQGAAWRENNKPTRIKKLSLSDKA